MLYMTQKAVKQEQTAAVNDIFLGTQDRFCCNNLPEKAGSDCHSEEEKLLMYMTEYGTVH